MADTNSPDWDQRDVLKKKDNVTQNGRGLQIWGDDPMGDAKHAGDGGQGTATRQSDITKGQEKKNLQDADEDGT